MAGSNLPVNTYAAGELFVFRERPDKIARRAWISPVFKPELPFEKSRPRSAIGTTFVEGLVYFKDRWFLYYGCADFLVGVAMSSAFGFFSRSVHRTNRVRLLPPRTGRTEKEVDPDRSSKL